MQMNIYWIWRIWSWIYKWIYIEFKEAEDENMNIYWIWRIWNWVTWGLIYKWIYIEFEEAESENIIEYILNLKNLKLSNLRFNI